MSVAITIAIVCAVAALTAAMWIHVRSRRQIASLMARLDDLEKGAQPRPGGETRDRGTSVSSDGSDTSLSADVLAGRTSYVGRIVSGGAEAATLAEQALVVIYRRLEEPLAPSMVADDLSVSLRTLERGLSVSLDCTPGELILAMKMREARRMLQSGRFRVGEVAHRLAFADASHFSRRFKRFFRISPSDVIRDLKTTGRS